ncbi:hypothetical protein FA15DRAFT_671187 [Coprinopsis marcescibilis]|uniref:Uncharacterized protein n=1 Tax=Coprinopsis marcescibilis TaxID=230819 RepID=A0A5C3KQV3_COPMA|nr:hypothetical protein FA15DRAFT_671187 [Coprinopsis marcescibilis]
MGATLYTISSNSSEPPKIPGDENKSQAGSSPNSPPYSEPPTPSTTLTPSSAPSTPLRIPEMASLSNIILHSPSSQIVGTPFATNCTPFEYPFPSEYGKGFFSSQASTLSSMMQPPSPSCSPPFSNFSTTSCTLSHPTNTMALSLSMAAPTELSFPQVPLTHPKMRMTPPPVPPGLMKRRKDKFQIKMASADFSMPQMKQTVPHDMILHHSLSDTALNTKVSKPTTAKRIDNLGPILS